MKQLLTLIVACALPMFAAAQAQTDETFYKKAAEGGMAEVEAGKLASEKGSSQAVQDYGAMMVKDHTMANTKLKTLASAKNVTLPKELDPAHKEMKKKLQGMSGAAFDKAYIEGQIADHKTMIALFEREAKSGTDPQAKSFAAETLPKLKAHLEMAQSIQKGESTAAMNR